MQNKDYFLVFFGSSELSIGAMSVLIKNGILPDICVTQKDKPKGRKLNLTETIFATFAKENNLKLSKEEDFNILGEEIKKLGESKKLIALTASYGKIIPTLFLEIFEGNIFNIHPSDLPKYRGASPIESQILDNVNPIKVTLMQMVRKMDAGDIIEKSEYAYNILNTENFKEILERSLGEVGGEIFSKNFESILSGEIKKEEQKENEATYTKMVKKDDGNVSEYINDLENVFRKFLAFTPWPSIYYFISKNGEEMRIKISKMSLNSETQKPEITHVIPEGKKEISFSDFTKNYLGN